MTTIKEIAEMAGVSRGTVDRVLNKRGAVSPATEERIMEIVNRLGYKPNRAGMTLAAQKKRFKLGVVMFGVGNPFFDDVIKGFDERTDELAGYNCTVIMKRISAFGVRDQIEAIDELVQKEEINGLAISPQNDLHITAKIDELFDEYGIPTVTFNTDLPESKRIAYVGSNYFQCGQTAAGLMNLMAGSKDLNIGVISGNSKVLCHTERIAGFYSCLDEYQKLHVVDFLEHDDDDFVSYDLTSKMLKNHPEINALFFAAAGTYGGCKAVIAAGREKDMKIVTFDKIDTTMEMLKKHVIDATICQQPREQGNLPLKILFDYLATGEMPKSEYNYTAVEIYIKENA
ncbi:MAG: LacI family DNA-binding transcriptional regulator [Lachnospiraceae bacterium]|nr:LacI family DNA-binding transcriptional regulator [Lachnospiraceae bacterium]